MTHDGTNPHSKPWLAKEESAAFNDPTAQMARLQQRVRELEDELTWHTMDTAPKRVEELILLRVSPYATATVGYWNGKHWCRGPGSVVHPQAWLPFPTADLPRAKMTTQP